MRLASVILVASVLVAAVSIPGASATPWIELQLNPTIPAHAQNPGGEINATCWMHEADPYDFILRIVIRDPSDQVIYTQDVYEQEYFTLQWIVPADSPDGVYHYDVEYFSDYWYTSASAPFLVAGLTAGICAYKFIDMDGNGAYDPAIDVLATGWEICVTPPASPGCKVTGSDYVVCWFFLPTGSYTVCETQQPGYVPTTPPCVDVAVAPGIIQKVEFGNMLAPPEGACCFHPGGECEIMTEQECADAGGTYMGDESECVPGLCPVTATEPSTWGNVKRIYR